MLGIYKITSPSNKIYIGQSVDIKRRWGEHKSSPHKGKLKNSFIKYGFENHIFEVLEECSVELLNERERYYQDLYDILGPNGLNSVLTNTSEKKFLHSKESLKKMSEANLGKIKTEEHKIKISKVHKGKVLSDITKSKISLKKVGGKLTKEHRENISRSQLGKSRGGKRVVNTETGEVFRTITLAANSIRINSSTLMDKLRGLIKNNTNFKYYK